MQTKRGRESSTQLDFLRANHCDAAQGYLLGYPTPAAEMAALLDRAHVAEAATA